MTEEAIDAAIASSPSRRGRHRRRRSRDSADERATAVTEEAIDAAIASSPEPARPAPPAIVPVPPNADVPKLRPGRPTGRKDRASTDSKASVASSGKASIASSTKGGKAAGSAAGSKKGDAGTDAEEEKAKEQQRAERERKAAERAEAAQKVEAERKAAQKAEAEAKARAKAKAEAEAQAKQAAKEAERKAAKAAKEAKAQAAQGEAYQDHFPMAPAGLLLSGTDHADATLMHPDDLEAMGELDGMGGYPGGYLGGGSSEMNVAYNRRQYLLPLEPPNAGERKLLAAERARSGRPAEPLMTPLFESGHGYIGQERHAHLHGRLVSRAELEAAGPRSRLAHQHAEERRAAKEERRRAEAEAMAAYHSYEDELLMDARQKAAAQREREMRQLEARLAEAMAIKQQGRSRRGGGGSGVNSNATSQMQSQTEEALNAAAHEEEMRMRAEAEEEEAMFMMNAQESIYSVVQHLSPFLSIAICHGKSMRRGPSASPAQGQTSSWARAAAAAMPAAPGSAWPIHSLRLQQQRSSRACTDLVTMPLTVATHRCRITMRARGASIGVRQALSPPPAAGRGEAAANYSSTAFCRRLTRGGRREEGGRALGRPLRTAARSRLVCCSPSARTTKSRASPTGGGVTSTTDEHAPLVSVCSTQVPRDS